MAIKEVLFTNKGEQKWETLRHMTSLVLSNNKVFRYVVETEKIITVMTEWKQALLSIFCLG